MGWSYPGDVDSSDGAKALVVRVLIARHGDDVARFLQEKIDALTAGRDYEQASEWFVIRNAVALSLDPLRPCNSSMVVR